MKKISQGKYEIFTTKDDAINKLMQVQGICRQNINDEEPIQFYCSKKGKIAISSPQGRRRGSPVNATNLHAEVIEQDNKTYVTFYTGFHRIIHALNIITTLIYVFTAIFAVVIQNNILLLLMATLYLASLVFELSVTEKGKRNSPKDSEILIKELEKRIDAVNNWDK